MKYIQQAVAVIICSLTMVACGSPSSNKLNAINEKKAAIEKLKIEKSNTEAAIKKLQEELAKIDSTSVDQAKIKLVGVAPVAIQDFVHYIDLRGKIDAENISYISPRGMGGQVKAVYVKEGDRVQKGQLLLKLDDAIQRQSVAAVKQQMEGIKTQLAYANSIYGRQKNLWDKGIGTEVQLLSAKTNVKGLEDQLKSVGEQVKVAIEQQNTTNVYSDVTGVADIVNVRVGEMFTGMGQIKIVNTSKLKAVANIPENYIGRIEKGTPVVVNISDINQSINTSIRLISQSIDPVSRGFVAEAAIPTNALLKPNQTAVIKIMDYSAKQAVVIPVNAIQSDEKNKYVFVWEKLKNGKSVSRKKIITVGEIYGDGAEIKTGLAAGEQLITEGYQNLYDGALISTTL